MMFSSSEGISLSGHNRTDGYPTRLSLKITSCLGSVLTHAQGFLLAPSLSSLGSALPQCEASPSSTRDMQISARQGVVQKSDLWALEDRTTEAKLDQASGSSGPHLHPTPNVRESGREFPSALFLMLSNPGGLLRGGREYPVTFISPSLPMISAFARLHYLNEEWLSCASSWPSCFQIRSCSH